MRSPLRRNSTPPPSARTTSLPSPPDSSEKTTKARARLSSPVIQALEIVRAYHQGYPPDSQWIKIHLQRGDYETLQQQFREENLWGYVEDKIRYDWNPHTRELIYRMPTPVHDIFTARVVEEIQVWIKSIRNRTDLDPHISTLAASIINRSTSRIFLHGEVDDERKGLPKHDPDAAFTHVNADYPGIVIETSFSQKRKDLPTLAQDYILGSLANVSVVVGLDIEYRGTKEATVSVWRPEEGIHEDNTPFLRVTQVVNAEPFRNEDGSLVPDGNLTLSLSDFVPSCMTSSITSPLPAFSISYLKLAGFLQLGEAHQQVSESKTGIGRKTLPLGMRVLKRSVSPEETLSPETERRFVESEEDIEERSMRDDELYRQGRQTKGRKTRS